MELYIHFPFCAQKCRYCDFISYPGQENHMAPYVDALLAEAERNAAEVTAPIDTVYFGGGTPSLLPADLMQRLLRGLRERLPLENVTEWTTEANPGTLTAAWLDAAMEGGVNRLSLGMQAAQDRLLRLMGRIHDREAVESSVWLARKAGIKNLNLDLIFGFPTQTATEWDETLRTALSLAPEHLSAYGLIPEEGTALWQDLEQGRLSLPEPEDEREMYEMLLQTAASAGYEQYEISNFAKPGYACQHNIGYWRQIPYLGLGVSAASMLRMKTGSNGTRYLRRTNLTSLREYLRCIAIEQPVIAEESWIEPGEARFETMMLGLRMNVGVSEVEFRRLHGVTLEDCYGTKLRKLQQDGLLSYNQGYWRLTRKGMDLQNTALVELMDE